MNATLLRSLLSITVILTSLAAPAQRTHTLKETEARLDASSRMADWRQKLDIPPGKDLFTMPPAMAGSHPRLLPEGLSMKDLRQRFRDPQYAGYRSSILEHADFYGNIEFSPPTRFDVEDPWRQYGDAIPWLALACQLEDDPASREQRLSMMCRYIEQLINWGIAEKDLPQSQILIGLSLAYDWCFDILDPRFRQRIRQTMLQYAEALRSPFYDAWQWRAQEMWLANHKWYNYTALAMAATALMEENQQAGITNNELKKWIDEAMEVYWVVEHKTFGNDGAPVEGYHYADYGSYPYWLMGMLSGRLANVKVDFFDSPYKRNYATHRLHSLLPGNSGFLVYGDSYPEAFDSAPYFHQLARYHRDPVAQYLGNLMSGDSSNSKPADDVEPVQPILEHERVASMPAEDGPHWINRIEAESFSTIPSEVEVLARVGSSQQCLKGWNSPGTGASFSITIPEEGAYRIWFKHSNEGSSQRILLIDGAPILDDTEPMVFPDTGGWARFRNTWQVTPLRDRHGAIMNLHLSQGSHTFSLSNASSNGLNLDWVALTSNDWTEKNLLNHLGETEGNPGISKKSKARHWLGLFWYDPSLKPLQDLSGLKTWHDSENVGIYTARKDWNDPDSSFIGVLCGPRAGWKVAETWTNPPSWGHLHPDAGSVIFYWGETALLPGVDYPREKWTTNHSTGVFRIPEQDRLVGQLGEGGRWGQDNDGIMGHPRVIQVLHSEFYHAYLMDLGGAYNLGVASGRQPQFPDYQRWVVYFPELDSILIADKAQTALPCTFISRLMTKFDSITKVGKTYRFEVGNESGALFPYSNGPVDIMVEDESVSSWPNGDARKVFSMESDPSENSVTAVLLVRGQTNPFSSVTIENDTVVLEMSGRQPVSFSFN